MSDRSNQLEDRIQELEDNDAFKDQLLQGTLKMRAHEKWIQQHPAR